MVSLTPASGGPPTDPGQSRRALIVLAAAFVVAVDQLSKWLVVTHLHLGDSVRVCSLLQLKYTHNSGMAFGLWSGGGKALPALAALCIVALLIWGSRYARRSPLVGWALALVVGGALGNMIDRLRLGHVTDFIDLSFWPVFNFADACVVVGAFLLLWHTLRRPDEPQPADGGDDVAEDDA
ncbi:MAG: signal peptidase II [Armatimonadetes bacterium]|nr:signal peptidase II [Armatimonadota bacterium]